MDVGSETTGRGTPAAGESHELRQTQKQFAARHVRHTHTHTVEFCDNFSSHLSLQPSRYWAHGGGRRANRRGCYDVIGGSYG